MGELGIFTIIGDYKIGIATNSISNILEDRVREEIFDSVNKQLPKGR